MWRSQERLYYNYCSPGDESNFHSNFVVNNPPSNDSLQNELCKPFYPEDAALDIYSAYYAAAMWQNFFQNVEESFDPFSQLDCQRISENNSPALIPLHLPNSGLSWLNPLEQLYGPPYARLYPLNPHLVHLGAYPQSFGLISNENPIETQQIDHQEEPASCPNVVDGHASSSNGDSRRNDAVSTDAHRDTNDKNAVPSSGCPSIACPPPGSSFSPVPTPFGTITLQLRHGIRVDLTMDKAVRLTHCVSGMIAALSSDGRNICIIHPNGKAILESGGIAHLAVENTLAKITERGVVFTALDHSLIYLVDASGTKSTTERFRDLERDFSFDLFYEGSLHGRQYNLNCQETVKQHFHRILPQGEQVWTIAGVRIKQSGNGNVRVTRDFGECVLRASPVEGTVSVSTNVAHLSASYEHDRLFFVRKNDKKVTLTKDGLQFRNGTQIAGFDKRGKIILP